MRHADPSLYRDVYTDLEASSPHVARGPLDDCRA